MSLPVPSDKRLDRLFSRYWENTLSAAEATELSARLEVDPAAREWFRWFCAQAAYACEWAAVRTPTPLPTKLHNRRRVLVGAGGGLAAGVAGWLLYRQRSGGAEDTPVTVTAVQGQVATIGQKMVEVHPGAVLPPGETLAAFGANSSAVLSRPDGSAVTLSAGSTVTVADHGNRLVVSRGGVTADLRPPIVAIPPLILGTSVAGVSTASGAVVGVSTEEAATEVQVQHGFAQVANQAGDPLADLSGGEQITVRLNGRYTRQPIPEMPEQFALDLSTEASLRWAVGSVDYTTRGAFLTPQFWYDPYHSAVLCQIRSYSQWTRGLVRLWPDSLLTIKYRANQPGRGQVCVVVRQMRGDRPARPATGVLEWNGTYQACGDGEWRTITVRAQEMLDCKEAPAFDPPWVAFLLIFNTYTADLGLRVADFRVSRPGVPADG